MSKDANKNNLIDNIPKLQWACRRGMLELDVLLGNFLNERYLKLAREHKEMFVELLESPDPELFSWLMGHTTPSDERMAQIIAMIRNHVRSRF